LFRGTTTCCVHKNDEDNPDIDVHNPRPDLRSRPTLGIVLIWKLKYQDGEYVDGYVYNPRDGKTYRIEAKVIDRETLKIRGYMGTPAPPSSRAPSRSSAPSRRMSFASAFGLS
jgi:uncharacterized protein (DUF2147 family)